MPSTKEKKWNLSIQLCKLIAAGFVVLIHDMLPGALGGIGEAAARFAVPFFFAVSGYFSFRISSQKFTKRILSMLYLNIAATLLYLAFDLYSLNVIHQSGLAGYFTAHFSLKSLIRWLLLNTNPISDHLWYLSAALVCYLLLWAYAGIFLEKCGYRPLYIAGVVLLFAQLILGSILPIIGIRFSYDIYRNAYLLGLPMFILGVYVREHQARLVTSYRLNAAKLFLLTCFGIVCSIAWRIVFYETELPFGAVIAAFSLMLLSANYPMSLKNSTLAQNLSIACNRISLIIYIIHSLLIDLFRTLSATGFLIDSNLLNPYLKPFITIFCSLLCGIVYHLLLEACHACKQNRRAV